MIDLDDFGVTYPAFTLGPLNLRVAEGERVALVGANGAGKSTALRALAGRLEPYRGSARVRGREVRQHRTSTRGDVGVLPERFLGFPWMTVQEHLDFLSGFYPTWDREYAGDLCRELEVPGDTAVGALSKGNLVKLSLVAAEAFRPPLLLLDEPTSGIDPIMRDQLLDVLVSCLSSEGRRTLVFSTHILEDISPVAHRVLLLRQGRLVGDVAVDDLRAESPDGSVAGSIRRRLRDA
jgi:ABC-2 type transport system ATP-binding protein